MRKKRRLKKRVKTILILLLSIIVISLSIVIITNNNKKITTKPNNKITKEKLIENLSEKTPEDITKEFLNWINEKYGEKVLENLSNEITNNNYNNQLWHKVTGNSYFVLRDLYNKKYDNMSNIKIMICKIYIKRNFFLWSTN